MEEMRSNQVTTCQKLDVKPYQYDEGIAGIASMYQDVALAVNKIPPGLYKRVLSAAVLQKVEYVIRMKTLEEYRDHPSYQGLRDEQIEQIILEDTKVFSKETAVIADARRAATMTIHDLMGKKAQQKLLEDEVYHSNLYDSELLIEAVYTKIARRQSRVYT